MTPPDELTPETRDALAPQLRAVSDTLDEWLMRAHGILSSWQHPDWFLEWLEKRGWTVADKARIEALERENRALRANVSKSVLRRLEGQGVLRGEEER